MRPRVLWSLGFSVVLLAALGAAGLLAWRVGYLAGQSAQAQAASGEMTLDGRVLVHLHAQVDDPTGLSRSHRCEFSASIANRTPYELLAARISLGSRTIDLPPLAAGHSTDLALWSILIPQEQRSCTEEAHRFQAIAHQANTTICNLKGASDGHCKRLIRVFADFDYPHLSADDMDARNAQKSLVENLLAGNLAVGTSHAVASDSFFKLGFDPKDEQKSDRARALVAAEQPFDPASPADVERVSEDARYATMGGPVTVLKVHKDKDQVIDWYKVLIWAQPVGEPRYEVIAWVPREDFDKARAKMH